MTAVLLGHWEPGTPDWHAARADGLGGSEVPAAMGLSPFESPFSLWHRKAGAVGPVEESPEMEWGKRLEPVIVAKFFDVHPEYDAWTTGTYTHVDRPWQIANPDMLFAPTCPRYPRDGDGGEVDAVIHDTDCCPEAPTGLLETKYSMFGDGWGDSGTADIPIHVRIQTLWYGDVLGLDQLHVAVLIGGCDWREYVITPAPGELDQIRAAARQFLDTIAAGQRPDIDEHTATYQVIKEMHPDIDGGQVELTAPVAEGYIAAKSLEKAAKDTARGWTARVADQMGNAHRAVWDGKTIATRQARDGGTPYVVIGRGLTSTDEPVLVGAATGADRFDLRPHEESF